MEQLLEKMQPEDENNDKTVAHLSADAEVNSVSHINPGQKKIKREISPSMELPNSVEHSKVVRYLGSSSGYYLVRDILSNEGEEVEEIKNAPLLGTRRDSIIEPDVGPLKFRKINVVDDDIMFVRDKTLAEHVDQLETDKLDLNLNIASKAVLTQLITR
jgi:hypothetical protein